ncbi:uncharacterized protein LOC130426256 [Triplophysa dalaica]|uniref:uncharacterized protein LOC130426256 n=1 Tax=Triplophysa dalaica TaxID=1582913 RepID=UPI0024DFB1CD|nr:uncharacterized protein LOC130426256 [Triplophysa dalaica]XP_056608919.1 uncharacterized protein LOC130426256 [Triplophysa dalaica]XP_056608929.1 uncharacterized protein LOC130426256 [Triplophysa dalaica]
MRSISSLSIIRSLSIICSHSIICSPSSLSIIRIPSSLNIIRSPGSLSIICSHSIICSLSIIRIPSSLSIIHSPGSLSIIRSPSSLSIIRSPSSLSIIRIPSSLSIIRSPGSLSIICSHSIICSPSSLSIIRSHSIICSPSIIHSLTIIRSLSIMRSHIHASKEVLLHTFKEVHTCINLQSTRMPSATISKTASVSSKDLPPAPHQPSVLPPPVYQQIVYEHIPSKAGTKVLKEQSDMVMSAPKTSSRVMPAMSTVFRPPPSITSSTAPTQVIPATSTSTTPLTVSSGPTETPQSVDTPSVWSRATVYKRKSTDSPTQVGVKLSRVHNLPVCTLCQQPTQGHEKYLKKNCPSKMMSTSKQLDKRVFTSYEHFTTVVDSQK